MTTSNNQPDVLVTVLHVFTTCILLAVTAYQAITLLFEIDAVSNIHQMTISSNQPDVFVTVLHFWCIIIVSVRCTSSYCFSACTYERFMPVVTVEPSAMYFTRRV